MKKKKKSTKWFPYSQSINDRLGQLGDDLKEGPLDPEDSS